ncbi:hypothetical protein Hdeb2414_s0009g00319171 [Helianthus debilis subsp. tardiflorus]
MGDGPKIYIYMLYVYVCVRREARRIHHTPMISTKEAWRRSGGNGEGARRRGKTGRDGPHTVQP